jgi:DNA-binding transcriptional ArsR family regulator
VTPHTELDLARAVARGGRARLLSADNTAEASVPLAEAVRSGRAYFVVPRPDLLVVDADPPAEADRARAQAEAFDLLVEAAERSGVACVVVASGRPGHRHAYLMAGPGSDRQLLESWCRERGLDLRDRGVRPPGAPHRDGAHRAELLSPSHPDRALAVLESVPDVHAVARLSRKLSPVELPARIRSALRHGHASAGYDSPSHARMGVAVAVRARNGPRSYLEALLNDTQSPLGATFRARPARWQQQELRRLWDKAEAWLASRPATNPRTAHVQQWAAAVENGIWSGMSGGTDLAVCEAFAVVAARAGSLTVGFALGDIAVAAGVSTDTARASVRRLLTSGWLTVHAPATARTSRVYQLSVPDSASDRATGEVPGRLQRELPGGDLSGDLARWGALGKLSVRVLRAVQQHGGNPAVLAAALGMRPAAVRYHLRKLSAHGLADRVGQVWRSRVSAPVVAAVTARCGTAGKGAAAREALALLRLRRSQVLRGYRLAWLERAGPPGAAVLVPIA